MDMWKTFAHCYRSEDLAAIRVDAQRLSRAVGAANAVEDPIAQASYEPPPTGLSSRLAADPAAMAASCALRAGQVAQETGHPFVAQELFQMVITNFPQPLYYYYVAQARRGLESLDAASRPTFNGQTKWGAVNFTRFRRSLAVAVLVSFGMVPLSHAGEPMVSDSSKTKAGSEQMVRGDVLMREGEFYIVKDVTGHEVRLHVSKETKLDGPVRVGDKIEARVTTEGHATSLTLHVPQNGTAPVMTGKDSISPQQSVKRLVQ